MELQVTWAMVIVLVVLAAAHAAEEILAEFRRGAARRGAGDDCSPAMERASLVVGRLGLVLLLAALALSGVLVDAFWVWIALGIIAATAVKDIAGSVGAQAYTPGLASSAACLAYVAWFLGQSGRAGLPDPTDWGAAVIGIAFIAINELSARRTAGATSASLPDTKRRSC